jgi:hypothetical protein
VTDSHRISSIHRLQSISGRVEIPGMEEHIKEIRERSYVRHVLAHHIETNDYSRVRRLRQKHGL